MSIAVSKPRRPTKLKFAARVVAGGTPESGNPEYWDGSVPWLTPVDLGNEHNDAITISKRTLSEAGVRAAGLERLPSGSVVISTRAPIGSVGLLACEAVTNQGCKALVLDNRALDSRFSFYLALDSAETLQSLGLGTTFAELSTYALKNLAVSLPSPAEQRRIAGYLDEATGKVDRLVALRRRQMELLREQRAALIQQAVTRGLPAEAAAEAGLPINPPLKDSGVPWIGRMPRDWQLLPLRAVLTERGEFNTDLRTTNFLSVLKDVGVVPYEEREASGNKKSDEMEKYKIIHPGDIVANRMNLIFGSVGLSAHFGCSSTEYYVLRARNVSVDTRFYGLIFQSKAFQRSLVGIGSGILAHRMRIYYEALKTVLLPVPSFSEQQEICRHVEKENERCDALHRSYERQLELLTEYRAALIHECVTGQRTVSQEVSVFSEQRVANVHFRRAVLGAEIIHRLHDEPTFGRVKLEKIIYLAEAYADINLEGHYQRAAAGPFDNCALRSVETQIQRQKWYQPIKSEKGTHYFPMEKAGAHQPYFEKYWTEQRPRFERIMELLRPLKTENCEMIATLFAVWNDRLAANQSFTDDSLVDEVLTNWHPSKQKIARDRWMKALDWMRGKKLFPSGCPVVTHSKA